MESIGFKEWALVCDAIGRGEQSLILRKGGIAEGRDGFTFRHEEFFLFPTWFHEQLEKTRGAGRTVPVQREGEIELRFITRVEFSGVITKWETVEALEPFHIWQRAVVRERFDYEAAPGVHFAVVRAFQLSEAWIIPNRPGYGGCRSWVRLPELPVEFSLQPVLAETEHARRVHEIRAVVEPATTR